MWRRRDRAEKRPPRIRSERLSPENRTLYPWPPNGVRNVTEGFRARKGTAQGPELALLTPPICVSFEHISILLDTYIAVVRIIDFTILAERFASNLVEDNGRKPVGQ